MMRVMRFSLALVLITCAYAHNETMLQSQSFGEKLACYQLQAEFTRDFLTAIFSHPAVNGIFLGGFWEARQSRPAGAMFKRDWTIKPNGEAFNDLVFRQWWTNASGETDADGGWSLLAMQGEYELEVSSNGKSAAVSMILPPEGQSIAVISPAN